MNTARVQLFVIGAGSPPETSFVNGGSGDEVLVGTASNNFLFAAGGNDDLYALLGHDTLNGGAGADSLVAEGGQNQLTGGLGTDLFVLGHEPQSLNDFEIITDLNPSEGDQLLVAVEGLVNPDGLIDGDRIALRSLGNGDSFLVADLDDDLGTGEDGLEAILARLDGIEAPGASAPAGADFSAAPAGPEPRFPKHGRTSRRRWWRSSRTISGLERDE